MNAQQTKAMAIITQALKDFASTLPKSVKDAFIEDISEALECVYLGLNLQRMFYLRGDATTDGSVRISSHADGTATLEVRSGGSWANISFS